HSPLTRQAFACRFLDGHKQRPYRSITILFLLPIGFTVARARTEGNHHAFRLLAPIARCTKNRRGSRPDPGTGRAITRRCCAATGNLRARDNLWRDLPKPDTRFAHATDRDRRRAGDARHGGAAAANAYRRSPSL